MKVQEKNNREIQSLILISQSFTLQVEKSGIILRSETIKNSTQRK